MRLAAITLLAALISTGRAAAQDEPLDWPREIVIEEGIVTLYQPQLARFDRNDLTGRAAISFRADGSAAPVFGALWFESQLETDRDQRIVTVRDTEVPQVRFPDASEEDQARLAGIIEREIERWDFSYPLDELLTTLDEQSVEEAHLAFVRASS